MRPLPWGSWPSEITARAASSGARGFVDVMRHDGDALYWTENRPDEGGRSAIMRLDAGTIAPFGPPHFNARTSVHEYGGGAYNVVDGVVYASSFDDQRLYRIDSKAAAPITPEPGHPRGIRYADLTFGDGRAIAVRETHAPEGLPVNELVRIDLSGREEPMAVAGGNDFYSSPRISPDGTRIAWLAWDLPQMPWEGTELWVADLSTEGDIIGGRRIAGGPEESVFQPEWSPDGILHCISDRTGWWNLYRADDGRLAPVYPADQDFGVPQWVFAMKRYEFLDDGRIVAIPVGPNGGPVLVIDNGEAREVPTPYAAFRSTMAHIETQVFLQGTGPDRVAALIGVDVDTEDCAVIREPNEFLLDPGYLSIPEPITFQTPDGPTHALFYPPAHPEHTGPSASAPPVIVSIHGGPTSAVAPALDLEKLFWTSRGIGIVDVNYGGSTNAGRAYRERLHSKWGIVDVRDCALAAAYLAETGRVDGDRLLIHGGSAGGYTTLMALAMHTEFAAGAAYFPVVDIEALQLVSHKFESGYNDSLIGPYPESQGLFKERSPLTHIDRITKPVLLIQGSDDVIVPREQAQLMRDALLARGTPVVYIEFEGEGHGFRSASSKTRSLEAELWFFATVLGFEPADEIEPLAGFSHATDT